MDCECDNVRKRCSIAPHMLVHDDLALLHTVPSVLVHELHAVREQYGAVPFLYVPLQVKIEKQTTPSS